MAILIWEEAGGTKTGAVNLIQPTLVFPFLFFQMKLGYGPQKYFEKGKTCKYQSPSNINLMN